MLSNKSFFKDPSYQTHFNYVENIFNLSDKLSAEYKNSISRSNINDIAVKDNLIKLTKESLNGEKKIVKLDNDYSYGATSWLPVKTYYLIFNILLKIDYLIILDKKSFSKTHGKIIKEFNDKLHKKAIVFSEDIFNKVFSGDILDFKIPSGANLSKKTKKEDQYKMLMKKIANYKLKDYIRSNNLNKRKSLDKVKIKDYIDNNLKVSIFDFFYQMRLRANYRDFDFIEKVKPNEASEYFYNYFYFVLNFSKALESMCTNIKSKRK